MRINDAARAAVGAFGENEYGAASSLLIFLLSLRPGRLKRVAYRQKCSPRGHSPIKVVCMLGALMLGFTRVAYADGFATTWDIWTDQPVVFASLDAANTYIQSEWMSEIDQVSNA
jgi:hypothetical protein